MGGLTASLEKCTPNPLVLDIVLHNIISKGFLYSIRPLEQLWLQMLIEWILFICFLKFKSSFYNFGHSPGTW
jgi:hypothetical protein